MGALLEIWVWLIAMAVLVGCSAFFSGSEAALFLLRRSDRREMESGGRAQRLAAGLLEDPDRLLTAVLFWNLVVNITFFAIASVVGLRLGRSEAGNSGTVAFTFGALLVIIFFSEMLPKSLAVLSPRRLASMVGIPLATAVRLVDPLMPVLRVANLLSRRLVWPRFQSEPYLELADLERAIELSTGDAALAEQEPAALRNIVMLSDIRVDELMRPRMQFLSFRPPVALADLEGRIPPSGYLLVTEPEGDEVAGAIHLQELFDVPGERLERFAEPVLYVPWCTTVADALQQMRTADREVAAVVNEFGETVGILTLQDILDTIFTSSPSRSGRLLHRQSIRQEKPGVFHVTGMTRLRRLARHFHVELPPARSVTVAGIVQETLQRLPTAGDQCRWGGFHFKVLDAPERGQMLLELTRDEAAEDAL